MTEPSKLRVMVVAADPLSTNPDELEEERAVIAKALTANKRAARVTPIHTRSEDELRQHLSSVRPDILHITTHGSANREISLEDAAGKFERKTANWLATLLRDYGLRPQCIVLNNCSLAGNQTMLLRACGELISFETREVFDVSLGFARSFYGALKAKEYKRAYRTVLAEMRKAGLKDLVEMKRPAVAYRMERVRMSTGKKKGGGGGGGRRSKPGGFRWQRMKVHIEPLRQKKTKAPKTHQDRKYQVWFATNRRPLDLANLENGFGTERDDKLHYGLCEVAIPKHHVIGSVGSSRLKRWLTWKDDRLRVLSRSPLRGVRFWSDFRAAIASRPKEERVILLFVHGYNVTFDGGVIRAAQLGADLDVPGATALFSWPSQGHANPLAYAADGAAIEGSEGLLADFLESLATATGAEHVHIIAHSMGNRGMIRAFDSLFSKISQKTKLRFSQIFLAAPDVDRALFKRLAVAYSQLSQRTTLYVSSRDKALWGSSRLHGYERTGYCPPVTIINGIDTIEVSKIDVSFLGHGYIAAARNVLEDMRSLMLADTAPGDRMDLETVSESGGLKYWRIRA